MSTLKELLTRKLKAIPGIEQKVLSEYPGFVSFEFEGKSFAHFDNDFEFDVKLTKSTIAAEGLEHPKSSANHPNRFRTKPHWIVLPFERKEDVSEIVRLVKVATEQKSG